ncbi:MAG: hypothetical protein IKX96_02245, partial [Firmicutes bacterium]|nr:hypothetical protein [Bacillota bacterium]
LYLRLYMALYFVMLLIEITYIFVLNFYLLSDDSFTSAGRKSRRLIKDHYIFTVIALILTIIIFSTITTSFAASVSSLALKLLSFSSVSLSAADARTLSNWIIIVNIFVGSIFAPAINIAALTSLFYQYIEEKDMLSSLSKKAFNDKYLKPYQVALFALALLGLVISNIAIGYDYITAPQPKVNANLEIVAHRGDATNAPDNSMPAFELALLESAEWIELDVQQTKDGVVIVSHDDEISRVSGQHLYIHDLTYEEATSLDVGSYFSSDFSDVRFSTLDEVLKLCKDKVKVMVEIKHNDYLVNMEEQVLQIINDNGMHDQCLIISTHTPTLMRIKELDPTMITCYTMFVAYGDVGSIPYVDYYTIEERNINSKLVTDIHRRGGKVYAWTINSEDSLQYLIDCSVDGILTDNPAVMYKYEKELAHDTGLARWLRIYINDLEDF